MKTVSASKESIEKAVEILKKGGVVVAPTDSVYGLFGDALNEQAVSRIRAIKGRDGSKPFQIAVLKKDVGKYGRLDANAKKVIEKFWPGDVNIIVKKTERVPDYISKDTVCLTCHRNKTINAIMQAVKKPLVSTSVNLSGMPPAIRVGDIEDEVAMKVDLVIDGGVTKNKKSNTIVDLTKDKIQIVREGPVGRQALMDALA